jgi:hypothetical protein
MGRSSGCIRTGLLRRRRASTVFFIMRRVFTTIDVPGGINPSAWGINNRGQIVGDYVDSGDRSRFHGFLATPQEE